MKKSLLLASLLVLLVAVSYKSNAQGCVAIRSTGGMGIHHADSASGKGSWELGINNRYYKSYKHFVGTEEQKERVDSGTNIINHQYTLDIALTKTINSRWSVAIDVPIAANARSQTYTQDGLRHRFSTHSFGVGDIRLSVYRWLLNPATSWRGNIQVGLGIKLPTGDYKVQDYFATSDTTSTLRTIDQSIQLGDGGTGFTAEVNAYYNLSRTVSVYGNFYYLLNPRDHNGVLRSPTPSANDIKYHTDVMSVPDQYLLRGGVNINADKFTFSAGVRYERLPAHDLIGGNKGFRRPGYILSAEPGINYKLGNVSLYAYVPVALVRNRVQSVSDIQRSIDTKTHVQGDAAFADYAVNIGATFRF